MMIHPMYRKLSIAILCVSFAVPAFAQSFPSRIVRIVVPYPAGGPTDALARLLARDLGTAWSQQVLVENVPGGDSSIGTSRVATAAPDGHTLLLTIDQTVVGNRLLFNNLPYDPDKSLSPITMLARAGYMVVVHPSVPAKSLRELVALARGAPGKLAYASVGRGTAGQLVLESIGKHEGVSFNHIPYKGVGPAITALVSGEVAISAGSPFSTGPMHKSGRIRAIATTTPNRMKAFPDVPTAMESGYPYLTSLSIWFGLFAPGGASPQIVERIHRDAAAIVKRSELMAKFLADSRLDAVANTPAEFADAFRADVASVGAMVKAANIQPE